MLLKRELIDKLPSFNRTICGIEMKGVQLVVLADADF